MIELRLPIVAIVEKLVAGSGFGVASDFVGLSLLEGGATGDDMDMRGDNTRKHNGITSLDGKRRAVDCEELTLGALGECRDQCGHQSELCRRHLETRIDARKERTGSFLTQCLPVYVT